jgi:hypothetical protein
MWKLLAGDGRCGLPSFCMWSIPRITVSASAAALLLSGCAPTAHIAGPAPQSISTPIFANEDEALAAATKAYAAYSSASDAVTREGGQQGERIAKFVSMEQLARELKGFEYYRQKSLFSRGNTKFDSVRIENYSGTAAGDFELTIYLCSDVSGIRLLNSARADVTPVDLPNRSPLEVGFELGKDSQTQLVVSRSEIWSGTDFCAT